MTTITSNNNSTAPSTAGNDDTSFIVQQPPLYKHTNNSLVGSTGSFYNSMPVELTTKAGYLDFIKKQEKLKGEELNTKFADDDEGKALVTTSKGEILASVSGEALTYLKGLI
ncbi:uncharacterized protein SCDLUD_000766 [Saccharomycodes ludwigii]|uniref:uncharacterized protein n=1 Tax=Saccharomycodes ludwigii TaxID=36035 RepID=UPI001E825E69|nr:hypothetical protein SCDLUD_000766 [Saccharomycodes ludwigii]KAH3903153.1 hypothetical protein SCDLUD_000766 [Saccharomycodes ludwigii]